MCFLVVIHLFHFVLFVPLPPLRGEETSREDLPCGEDLSGGEEEGMCEKATCLSASPHEQKHSQSKCSNHGPLSAYIGNKQQLFGIAKNLSRSPI